MIRIYAMDDIDLVSFIAQCVTEAIKVHGISAEAVGGIESGKV
jgi:hypothetical protein